MDRMNPSNHAQAARATIAPKEPPWLNPRSIVSRALAVVGSRRRLLGRLSALPLAAALTTLAEHEGATKRRRANRRERNQRQSGNNKENRKGERTGDEKPAAFGRGDTLIPCGLNLYCALGADICVDSACRPCDVCATCTHTTVQSAIDAANPDDTITICAGAYKRASGPDSQAANIDKALTLIGAGKGSGDTSTVLDGGGGPSGFNVVYIWGGIHVTLRNLTVTGANGNPGIFVSEGTTLALQGVSVTRNHYLTQYSGFGGGIYSRLGALVLGSGTEITDNTALIGGGIRTLGGVVKLNAGSSVTGNTATHSGGGGIDMAGSTLERNGGVLTGNTPYDCRKDDNQPCF